MRREVLSVALGAMAAVAFVSIIMNLQPASMPATPAEKLITENLAFEVPKAGDRGPPQGLVYLPLILSLVSAVLVYQASGRLLARAGPR